MPGRLDPLKPLAALPAKPPALALAATVLALALAPPALGAAGEPDPSFGNHGFTILDEPELINESLSDVVVLPDGKILGAGGRGSGSGFLLARFNPDGTPDQGFGSEGIRVNESTGKAGDPTAINAMELRRDGKVVAAGSGLGGKAGTFEFARYRADGTLDPEFGNGGLTSVPVEPSGDAFAVAQTPAGGVVGAGGTGQGGKAAVVELTEGGHPDKGFNGSGVRIVDVAESSDELAESVRVLESGTILVGGFAEGGAFLTELDPSGELVQGFGEGGIAVHDLGTAAEPSGELEDLRLLPDGRILGVGAAAAGPNDFELVVARFTPSGELDQSFGDGGVLRLNPTPGDDEGFATTVLADGRILVAGVRGETSSNTGDSWILRLTPNGQLDPSFGDGGQTVASAAAGEDEAVGLALQPDGRAVIAGSAVDGASRKLLVGRFTADPPVAEGGAHPTCAGKPATIVGTQRGERIHGTRHRDVIAALGGRDTIAGGKGNDLICAGPGNDRVNGGKGRDTIRGEGGADRLAGGAGRDLCDGGGGHRDRATGSCEHRRHFP